MPALRWAAPDAAEAGDVVLFNSQLPLRSRRFAPGFFRDTMRIKRLLDSLAGDPDGGLLWYELTAHPLANRYATASAWRSDEHLERFAADPVHVAVMARQREHLGEASFDRTHIEATRLPITS